MRPLNKTPPNEHGALTEGAVAPSLEAACKLIIGPLDSLVDRKKTLYEINIHKIGDNLDDVPPLISLPSHHLHAILRNDFFLVLCFFWLETLDDPIEALHYNLELYFFIARDDLTGLVQSSSWEDFFCTWNFGNSSIILYLVVVIDVVASRFPI